MKNKKESVRRTSGITLQYILVYCFSHCCILMHVPKPYYTLKLVGLMMCRLDKKTKTYTSLRMNALLSSIK